MKEKRISGTNQTGWRRYGDPPAWLDESLPLGERRILLDRAIRSFGSSQQDALTFDSPASEPLPAQKPDVK